MPSLEGLRAVAMKVLGQFIGGLALILLAASLMVVYGGV